MSKDKVWIDQFSLDVLAMVRKQTIYGYVRVSNALAPEWQRYVADRWVAYEDLPTQNRHYTKFALYEWEKNQCKR